jgi:hypothetical protein
LPKIGLEFSREFPPKRHEPRTVQGIPAVVPWTGGVKVLPFDNRRLLHDLCGFVDDFKICQFLLTGDVDDLRNIAFVPD